MKTEIISELKSRDQEGGLLAKVTELTQVNKRLQEQVDWLKKQLFGKKSEHFVEEHPGILYLPGFPLQEQGKSEEEETVSVPEHKKRKLKFTPPNTIS